MSHEHASPGARSDLAGPRQPGTGPPTSTSRARDPDAVARLLTSFVNSSLMAPSRTVGPDDELEAAGVDSMGLLRLLLFVEAEFGVWVPDEDLVEDNTASVARLSRYLCRREGWP